MNKKRLQRLGVVCMAAAMVLTTVSFPRVAKAEGETSMQTEGATSTELEKGKVLMQVDPTVLQNNAIRSSEMPAGSGKDGPASWAFDGDDQEHWWHSQYPVDESTVQTVRPWIGSGFGQTILLKKVTYLGCTDKGSGVNNHNNIKKYLLYYADMQNPKSTPTSSDWILVKSGSFTDRAEEQAIVLDQAVKATHFKLVAVNTNNWTGNGSVGDGSTCAKNIKVYAEDTLNLTVTAPVEGRALQKVENEDLDLKVATVEDQSNPPIDISGVATTNDRILGGEISSGNVNKMNALKENTPFMIRMKVKLIAEPTTNYILINRGGEPYQIAYGIDNGTPRIKFQMREQDNRNPNNHEGWHETKVCVTDKIGQEVDILALYTGSSMKLWVDGEQCGDYSNPKHNTNPNPDSGYTMTNETTNALKIGDTSSPAAIKSVQVVYNSGITLNNNSNYNDVISAFESWTKLLNLNLQVNKTTTDHQYTLTSKWTNTIAEADMTDNVAVNRDETIENYRAVVTATPKESLKFTVASMPQTLKVNVDGTNIIEDVPVTSSSVDENGVLKITYDFEELFIGGSLRMDDSTNYEKTSMRYGYDFELPKTAEFVGCVWYYGTSATGLTNSFAPAQTKFITNPDGKGEGRVMKKRVYSDPSMEIVILNGEDIICASNVYDSSADNEKDVSDLWNETSSISDYVEP